MRKLKNEELGRLSVEAFKASKKMPVVIVLDNIRSVYNIGSVFRTADAFRVEKIYLTGICARPPHRGIHKTALGATESVDWAYAQDTPSLVRRLKREGLTIAAVEQAAGSTDLSAFRPDSNEKYALVFGHEVLGVMDEVIAESDLVLEIPQFGTKHSLNIAVSVGVVMWDVFSKISQ